MVTKETLRTTTDIQCGNGENLMIFGRTIARNALGANALMKCNLSC
jgi:hypothetical protein